MTGFTLDTIRNIGRYAGTLPPQEIADRLGFTLGFVERVAREQKFDLRVPVSSTEPQQVVAPTPRPQGRPRTLTASERRQTIAITLRAHDLALLRENATARFVKPAAFLAHIIEGAIARGKVDELAGAARSYRPGNEIASASTHDVQTATKGD